ncbi:hypothetical protein KEM52_005729 [Ascosphaera acerosa]|nr:hypothetical protein KEM52_005729 [Ascosphaera acerosa]
MGAVGEHEANAQGGQQDASPDLQPPPRLSLVPFGGNAEEYDEPDLDLTVRSIELPRERPNRPRLSMFPRISIGPDALEDLDMDSGVARGGARAMYDGGDDYDGKDDDDDDDGGGGTGIVLPGDGLPGDETENLNRFQLDFSFPTPEAADTVLEETAATAALAADDHDFQLEPVRTRTQAAAAQPFVSSDATLPEPAAQDANSRQPGSLRSSTSASFFRPPASGPPSAEFVISRDRKFHFDSDASLSDPAVQDDLANRRAGHPDLRFRNQRDDAHGSGMPEPRGAAPPMGYFSLPRVVSSPARPSPRPRPRSQHKHAPGSDATLSDPATRRDQPAEHVPSDRLADRSDYGTARAGALPPVGTFYIGRPPPGPRGAVPDLQGRTLTDPAMQFAYADYAQQPQPYPYAAIRHDMRYDDPNLSPLRDIPEPNGPYLSSEPDGSYLSPLRDIPEPYGPYLSSLEDVPDSDGPGPLPFSDVPEPDEPSDGVASAEKTQAPKLPSSTVKKIAMRSTRGGKLNKGTVDVLSQATAWFFEQMSADLAAFADHAGRKVIDESDVVTLMRRQRLIGPQTSVFALAKKHLPQELVQEIRLPARRRLKRG